MISKSVGRLVKKKPKIKLEKDLKLGEEMNELMLAKYSENESHLCVLQCLKVCISELHMQISLETFH